MQNLHRPSHIGELGAETHSFVNLSLIVYNAFYLSTTDMSAKAVYVLIYQKVWRLLCLNGLLILVNRDSMEYDTKYQDLLK